MTEFQKFDSIKRLSRDMVVTEKIDGSNAQICITEDGEFLTGSRKRWITPEQDNFGFAKWAHEHEEELREGLGVGKHFGEWWGQGIQRKYGLEEKKFSLFNTGRRLNEQPTCCHVVPVLYEGMFSSEMIDNVLEDLYNNGSIASPGFMKPEGVVIWHTAARILLKKTLDHNDEHKFMDQVLDPRAK